MSTTQLLTTGEVAALLGCSKPMLVKWRREGGGPPFVQVGRFIRYAREDVDTWLAEIRRVA